MPNYLCMQRSEPGPPSAGDKPTPAQMETMYAEFNTWRETFKDNIVDMGGRLGAGKLVSAAGVTDGPLVEVKELIGGYMVVSADSLEQAIEVAGSCPGLVGPRSGCWVREIHTP